MVEVLQTLTSGLYLLAGLVAGAGVALRRRVLSRVAVGLLAAGAFTHALAFSLLHTLESPPPLTHLPSAISFTAWIGTVAFLVLAWRRHVAGLVAFVAPMSFLGVFAAWLLGASEEPASTLGAGSLPHAHVLLASAGLGLLGLAGLAGGLFLLEHRRLKSKHPFAGGGGMPSLESLDRAGALAVTVGFPLLTLGVVTGGLWLHTVSGRFFTGSVHETLCLFAWGVYGVLVTMRFAASQAPRRCAQGSVAGFAVLGFAVVGVELLK